MIRCTFTAQLDDDVDELFADRLGPALRRKNAASPDGRLTHRAAPRLAMARRGLLGATTDIVAAPNSATDVRDHQRDGIADDTDVGEIDLAG